MAYDSNQQPLLSGLLDPPNQPKKTPAPKNRRFRRSRSSPSTEVLRKSSEGGGLFPGPKLIFGKFHPSFRLMAIFLVVYLAVGVLCFYVVKGQIAGNKTDGVLDALYFSIVTMTTVGYGDLVPNSDTAKLLACAFVFIGMAIIALFLSKAADYFVEKQEVLLFKALHMNLKGGEAHMLRDIETSRIRYKFYTTALFLTVLVIVGTMFLWKVEKLKFVDAFYCVCATITTLGYGDKSFSSEGGRAFAVFWIVASTICVAQFFFYLAELNTEHRQKLLAKWVLTRRMTYVDIEAADLDGDNEVGAAEFVVYKLKEMGKISQEDIAHVLEEFEDLDVDQSGTLSKSDLSLAQSTS
ncbi:two pore potassium channel a [Typha latifolia]|uniref:two pore potassium channel a n=1 Tax=Typha latifolia TaxID=4733 RepID=UPI003C2F3C07